MSLCKMHKIEVLGSKRPGPFRCAEPLVGWPNEMDTLKHWAGDNNENAPMRLLQPKSRPRLYQNLGRRFYPLELEESPRCLRNQGADAHVPKFIERLIINIYDWHSVMKWLAHRHDFMFKSLWTRRWRPRRQDSHF